MAASSIYVDAPTQADIDLLSGIIYVFPLSIIHFTIQSYQHDFQTAFSFFFEAYDAYESLKDTQAAIALKYMVLMKILSGKVDYTMKNVIVQISEMQAIFQNHLVVENWNEDMKILHAISIAFQNRDLSQLNSLLQEISFFDELKRKVS